MVASIQSNNTGLAIAEEVLGTPKILPGTPIWYAQEPNSYSDFGAEISTVAREPISNTRQNKKGTITDVNATGGFGVDVTQNNLERLMQGFMFANAIERMKTQPLNGTQIAITGVATSGIYSAASGLDGFRVGDLVLIEGFANSENNGFAKVTAVTATDLTVDLTTVTDASPASTGRITAVGFEFASGDLVLTVSAGLATLTSSAKTMTQLGLEVGDWIFVGGDASGDRFANGSGYMRVKTVTTSTIVCDKATDLKTADAGSGKTVQIFFGTLQKNAADPTDIVQRSYQLERQLGNDGAGIQSEYILGAFANEITFNIPTADKFTADLGFVALDSETVPGSTGIKSGTRVAALAEEPYNTSSTVRRTAMSIIDSSTLSPTDLFTYIEDINIKIENGVNPLKAVGVVGAFDVSLGNFVVSGSTTAYFATVSAINSIRANADITVDVILAKNNAGMIFDIPLMGVGDGKPNVEKYAAVKISLSNNAAENADGYTLGFVTMHYLPTVAMPA